MKTRMLTPFLIITFGWGWSLVGLILAFPEVIQSLFGELSDRNPLFILAVYSPAIAAFAVVLWTGGPGAEWRSRYFSAGLHRFGRPSC